MIIPKRHKSDVIVSLRHRLDILRKGFISPSRQRNHLKCVMRRNGESSSKNRFQNDQIMVQEKLPSSVYVALGFFVPYFDRLVTRLPTPPCGHTVSMQVIILARFHLLTKSIAPRTKWYLTPGQSCARPPRTRTTECC
jgi:hypothetical protein